MTYKDNTVWYKINKLTSVVVVGALVARVLLGKLSAGRAVEARRADRGVDGLVDAVVALVTHAAGGHALQRRVRTRRARRREGAVLGALVPRETLAAVTRVRHGRFGIRYVYT